MDKDKILFTTLSRDELGQLMETSVRRAIVDNPSQPENEVLLSTKQAAALIKYRPSSLYELVRKGKVPYTKARGKLLFPRDQLLAWAHGKPVHSNTTPETPRKKIPKRKPPPKPSRKDIAGNTDAQLSLYPDNPDNGP